MHCVETCNDFGATQANKTAGRVPCRIQSVVRCLSLLFSASSHYKLQIPFKHVLVQVLKGVVGMHANDKNESLRSGNDKISLGHSVGTKQQNDKKNDRVIWPPAHADT